MKVKINSVIFKSKEDNLANMLKLKRVSEEHIDVKWAFKFLGWENNGSRR